MLPPETACLLCPSLPSPGWGQREVGPAQADSRQRAVLAGELAAACSHARALQRDLQASPHSNIRGFRLLLTELWVVLLVGTCEQCWAVMGMAFSFPYHMFTVFAFCCLVTHLNYFIGEELTLKPCHSGPLFSSCAVQKASMLPHEQPLYLVTVSWNTTT